MIQLGQLSLGDIAYVLGFAGLPHGMPTTHADMINRDILEFLRR